jgi:hypothetical protein
VPYILVHKQVTGSEGKPVLQATVPLESLDVVDPLSASSEVACNFSPLIKLCIPGHQNIEETALRTFEFEIHPELLVCNR